MIDFYLLDTSICAFFLRGKCNILQKINEVGWDRCCVSEVTVAELKYGVECSMDKEHNMEALNRFLAHIKVVPFKISINTFSKEKARLRKAGTPIDDFDLLIGSTAVALDFVMVTDNIKHFDRIEHIRVENWVTRE